MIDAFLRDLAGGDSRDLAVAESRCLNQPIGCGSKVAQVISPSLVMGMARDGISGLPFRDELALREWRITGLCQNCQDDFDASVDVDSSSGGDDDA